MNILLGILASMVTAWFSRQREFRADEGGAYLSSPQKMASALRRLSMMQPGHLPDQMAAFGISSAGTLSMLFATHPPLEERIAALEAESSGEKRGKPVLGDGTGDRKLKIQRGEN